MDQTTTGLDQALIALLLKDARRPATELARLLNSTRSTVQNRIARLVDRGVIRRFTLELSEIEAMRMINAVVFVRLDAKDSVATIAAIKRMDRVERLHTLSGHFDLIADLRVPTAADLDAALAAIRKIPGVASTDSSILLAKMK